MYEKGKIYKLECSDGHFYIGSTCDTLDRRLRNHKWCSTKSSSKLYKHLQQLGWDNVNIILLEPFPCETKHQLRKQEQSHICKEKENPFCLNWNSATLSNEERLLRDRVYANQHKEERRTNHKRWREQNREKWLEHQRLYREKHKVENQEYQRQYYRLKNNLD